MTETPIDRYCSSCGQALPQDARFCPACGRPSGATSGPVAGAGPHAGPPTGRDAPATAPSATSRAAPVLVFALLAGVGLVAAYAVFDGRAEPQRAVPGSPTPPPAARAAADTGAEVPPDHPPIELPPEVIAKLDEIAKAAEAAPADAEAWRMLARARYRAGMLDPEHYEGADAAIDRLLALAPKDPEGLRMKANIAYDTRRFADAEREFRRYLDVDPKDPGVRTDLASAVLFQGRTDEARKMYESVIETNPDFVQAHVNLGITLHGEGKREEGLAALRRARDLAGDPAQRERVEMIVAAAEGRPHAPAAAPAPAAGDAGPPAAHSGATAMRDTLPGAAGSGAGAPRSLSSNAASGFQKGVDALFAAHAIVAPKITRIEWRTESAAAVHLAAFPMDKMPPVMRNKFKSTMNEKIATLASEHAIEAPRVDLVATESGRVMDTLDGKEFVGAFDPQE